jgi:ribosomal protein S18 acetylase RimI-like enzyme
MAEISAGLNILEIKYNELGDVSDFWDYTPSWQNSFDAILRKPEDFRVFAAMDGGRTVAYGIIEPESGDITQLAVHPDYRRLKTGSAILAKLVSVSKHSRIKLINSEVHCTALTTFCESAGLHLSGKQFEMILPLDEDVVSGR